LNIGETPKKEGDGDKKGWGLDKNGLMGVVVVVV
jgi:hypothetical protein